MDQADVRLRNITQIVEKNNVKAKMAQIMQRTLRERALSMHIMSNLTADFLKDAEYQRFNAWGGQYPHACEKLGAFPKRRRKKTFITPVTRRA